MARYGLMLMCAALAAGQSRSDPSEVLNRVILKVRENSRRIPNYACVETVTRDYYTPLAQTPRACDVVLAGRKNPTIDMRLQHSLTDRLRLDVAMSKHGELHSWVGASRFEDKSIDQIAGDGPLGTGAFGGFVTVVFNHGPDQFTFQREVVENGRTRMEFSFEIPESDSTYKVKVYNSWATTAYTGSFSVDPKTELVDWLRIETALLPPAAGTCTTNTTIDLAMTAIGDGTFLLAKGARQRFIGRDASEALNTILFSNCREYRGDSTISFDTGDTETAPGPPVAGAPPQLLAPKPIAIPGGLEFTLEFEGPIDTRTAAAGDPVSARLVSALRDRLGKTLVPAGARVQGRLLRVQVFHGPKAEAIVVFRPATVEAGGVRTAFFAKQDLIRELRQERAKSPEKRVPILLPFQFETNAGLFRFPGEQPVVPKGFRSEWRTAPPQ
jgi:hypothetical protein